MQRAKESFYLGLRDALALLNPARTVVIRGALRPAIAVEENELAGSLRELPETFVLVWGVHSEDVSEPVPMVSSRCEFRYWTEGSAAFAGVDSGRVLTAMDEELRRMLAGRNASVVDASVSPPAATGVRVFWSEPEFAAAVAKDGRLMRSAFVDVFAPAEVPA